MHNFLHRTLPLFVTTAASPALAQASGSRPYLWHDPWDWGWGHMFFGPLPMLVFWGGIILLIVLAVRWLGGGPGKSTASSTGKSALDILSERFARGEIDRGEFEERKKFLSS